MNTNELVTINHNQAVTTSRKIAEVFGKEHKVVLKTIRDLEIPEDWRLLNFRQTQFERKTPTGGVTKSPMYLITRDGFTLLAMGFTGAKAMEFKLAYIAAYNEMEKKLHAADSVLQSLADAVRERTAAEIQKDVDTIRIRIGRYLQSRGYQVADPFALCCDLAQGKTDALYDQQLQFQLSRITDNRILECGEE